jgi:hypothetical protein
MTEYAVFQCGEANRKEKMLAEGRLQHEGTGEEGGAEEQAAALEVGGAAGDGLLLLVLGGGRAGGGGGSGGGDGGGADGDGGRLGLGGELGGDLWDVRCGGAEGGRGRQTSELVSVSMAEETSEEVGAAVVVTLTLVTVVEGAAVEVALSISEEDSRISLLFLVGGCSPGKPTFLPPVTLMLSQVPSVLVYSYLVAAS